MPTVDSAHAAESGRQPARRCDPCHPRRVTEAVGLQGIGVDFGVRACQSMSNFARTLCSAPGDRKPLAFSHYWGFNAIGVLVNEAGVDQVPIGVARRLRSCLPGLPVDSAHVLTDSPADNSSESSTSSTSSTSARSARSSRVQGLDGLCRGTRGRGLQRLPPDRHHPLLAHRDRRLATAGGAFHSAWGGARRTDGDAHRRGGHLRPDPPRPVRRLAGRDNNIVHWSDPTAVATSSRWRSGPFIHDVRACSIDSADVRPSGDVTAAGPLAGERGTQRQRDRT